MYINKEMTEYAAHIMNHKKFSSKKYGNSLQNRHISFFNLNPT